MMLTALDVAEHILCETRAMTGMKLQKLVYYCQAWHIVWTDDVLFNNRIEAWRDGPVCPDLWREHANEFRVSHIRGGDPSRLTARQKKTIKQVIKFYGGKTAQWLSDLTHLEAPWAEARRGTHMGASSNAEISPAAMSRYYASL